MNLDREVADGPVGGTLERPRSLEEIIKFVDYRQHLIMTLAELNESLDRLIRARRVVQVGEGFVPAPGDAAATPVFRPVTQEAFDDALRRYRAQPRARRGW